MTTQETKRFGKPKRNVVEMYKAGLFKPTKNKTAKKKKTDIKTHFNKPE